MNLLVNELNKFQNARYKNKNSFRITKYNICQISERVVLKQAVYLVITGL